METFWFFRLRFRRAYDCAYDSDFRFHLVISSLMTPTTTPTTTPTLTPSQVKTSLKIGQGKHLSPQTKMYPQPIIHRRIQGQRLIFHFNSLATESQPCERRQAALRVPSETIKRLQTSAYISSTTRVLVCQHGEVTKPILTVVLSWMKCTGMG